MRALEELRIELEIATKEKELAWLEKEAAEKKWVGLLNITNGLEVSIRHLESKEPKESQPANPAL